MYTVTVKKVKYDAFISSDAIWVIICVDAGGVLGVTQQLNSSSFDFHNTSSQSDGPISNPFNMGMVCTHALQYLTVNCTQF